MSQFAGPVLASDDLAYCGQVLIPREYWKIVIYRLTTGTRHRAFVL